MGSRQEEPLMWTTVSDGQEGVALVLRGELSTKTAPALASLLQAMVDGRERLSIVDLREVHAVAPASERLLERWGAVPGTIAGTYQLDLQGTGPTEPRARRREVRGIGQ